ncbi:shikimate / quinate 5-dehydrogenase family protein, partial [Vibrio parahaemolyticus V-223/04]
LMCSREHTLIWSVITT